MKKTLHDFVKVITIVWFVTHFVLTILYVMPLNPIKIRLLPLLNATIGTFFSQNWSLFAPNPVAQDHILLVQPLIGEDTTGIVSTNWYNLSSSLWEHFQQNRFSAYDRLARSQSNALRTTLTGDHTLMPLFNACNNGDSLSCVTYIKSLAVVRKLQIQKLVRIASAFSKDIEKYDNQFGYVAIRIRVVTFPVWSKRLTEEPVLKDYDLGVHKIDADVVPIGLFK